MIQPSHILFALVLGFSIQGLVLYGMYSSNSRTLLVLDCLTICFIITSQLTKQYLLVQKKQKIHLSFLIAWILTSIYYLVIALALLIYFSQLQQNQIQFDTHLYTLMIYNKQLSFSTVAWINLTYYFGNAISIGFYTRQYYRMFWVNHIVHIYRYLKRKVKNLNQTLLSNLPVVPFINQLASAHCSLCLEEYNNIQPITKLVCNHYFHRNCVRIWVLKSNACPLCRRRVIF